MIKADTLFLKNMFSNSCIKLIELDLKPREGFTLTNTVLGEISFEYDDAITSKREIISWLKALDFDVVVDPNVEIVEKTKIAAIELIYKAFNNNSLIRNSEYISEKLQLPYDKISRVFSQVTGTKLEKYIILLKLEKAKEMLLGQEYSVSEIAFMMDYSSVQYFSNQFKKNVGVTISQFKENPQAYRKPLENII